MKPAKMRLKDGRAERAPEFWGAVGRLELQLLLLSMLLSIGMLLLSLLLALQLLL